jgi:hypothetical protein
MHEAGQPILDRNWQFAETPALRPCTSKRAGPLEPVSNCRDGRSTWHSLSEDVETDGCVLPGRHRRIET